MKLFKNLKVKLLCSNEKHDWEYYTWGSAVVDNLDGTCSLWQLPVRECHTCNQHQLKLKKGWEDSKKSLTIEDLE